MIYLSMHGYLRDLTRRTASDKILRDKEFSIAKNPKYDGYQRVFTSMVYKFFDKKTAGGAVKNETILNKELAEQLHKPIIRKLKKRKVYSPFTDSIWDADFVDMQLIINLTKKIVFYYALLIFSVNKHELFL